jgi:hypothetical protein
VAKKDGEEKRDVGNWIRFLESQVESRNSEIGLLRAEVQEKSKIIENLQSGREQDTYRLAEMTEALVIASEAIRELESQLSSFRETESRLSHDADALRAELQKSQQQAIALKSTTGSRRSPMYLSVGIFLIGLASGLSYRAFSPQEDSGRVLSEASEVGEAPKATESPKATEAAKSPVVVEVPDVKEKPSGVALSAKPLSEKNLMEENLNKQKEVSGGAKEPVVHSPALEAAYVNRVGGELVSRDDWMNFLGELRRIAFKVEKAEAWSVSRDYRDLGYPVVITRDQFRDVVSKTLPTALPSRGSDGLILFELDSTEVDREQLVKHLKSEGIASASVCRPGSLDPSRYRRLSIVVSAYSTSLECLKSLMASQWFNHAWEELSIVSLAPKARFSASYYTDKKFVSFQEWEPDWITAVTVGDEADARGPAVFRAKRLASIARVLTKSSDVHVEIPASENGYVSFGNFAVVPNGLVKGALRATRISVATGKVVGKSVSQPVAVNAKAVIINGAEVRPEKKDRY